jgi:TrmH family RNA methyltransferase
VRRCPTTSTHRGRRLPEARRQPGVHSPRVRLARQLAKRAKREERRLFLAEGPQAVREALGYRSLTSSPGTSPGRSVPAGSPPAVTDLFVTAAALARHGELVDAAADAGIAVLEVSAELMAELAPTVTPQGLLAVCSFLDVPLGELTAARPRLVVVLANVRDPGNAGTVLRTADAAGAGGVIFAGDSVDPYNGKCVRSSAGSLFHLPVVTGVSAADAASALRGAGLAVLAADGGADLTLDELQAAGRLAGPTAWLFGNEAWGLPAQSRALADEVVAVPIYGRAESLNLAAAAAVCLYACARASR